MKSKFKVAGRFDGAPTATVSIDRASGVVSVRPLRRKRTYDLPLAMVAAIIVERIIKAEVNERLSQRRKARR